MNRIKSKDEGGRRKDELKEKSFLLFIQHSAFLLHRLSSSCPSMLIFLSFLSRSKLKKRAVGIEPTLTDFADQRLCRLATRASLG